MALVIECFCFVTVLLIGIRASYLGDKMEVSMSMRMKFMIIFIVGAFLYIICSIFLLEIPEVSVIGDERFDIKNKLQHSDPINEIC